MPLEPGQTAEVQQVVTRELTADVLGNPGVTVFATPFVLTLFENAAHAVMAPHLPRAAPPWVPASTCVTSPQPRPA